LQECQPDSVKLNLKGKPRKQRGGKLAPSLPYGIARPGWTGLRVEVQGQFRVYEVINPPQEHRVIIYSWARAVGGSLWASDDISEAKFVSLHELGALPLTPLVTQVLKDAGYIVEESRDDSEASDDEADLLFPVLIAGARSPQSPHRHRGSIRPRRRRPSPVYKQSTLLFDANFAE